MASLDIKFLGITFPNPYVLASSPCTNNAKLINKAFRAGWGGAVIKTIGLEPTSNPCPRLFVMHEGKFKRGMINYELITDLTMDQWIGEIETIRNEFPDRPLIASIMGGGNPDDWHQVMRKIEPCGINAFEMNVSCPNINERKGAQLGQDPESLHLTVGWVREATHLPIIVKLTPNVTDIVFLAQIAKDAGADAVTATNTLSGFGGVDLDNFNPKPNVGNFGIFGGYSGPGLKAVAMRCAASIAKGVDIPVIGCGGIATWQDAAEFIALGASVVEVSTAAMWNGFEIIDKMCQGLSTYLETHHFKSPIDFKGKALPKIGRYDVIDLKIKLKAVIDEDECTGCGMCVKACDAGAFEAIDMVEKVARISKRCDGCGLCIGVCPINCIKMAAA